MPVDRDYIKLMFKYRILRGLTPSCKLLVCMVLSVATANCLTNPNAAVKWQPARPANGSPMLIEIGAPAGVQSLKAQWLGHSVSFYHSGKGKIWCALAGVPLQTPAGTYELQITETLANGRTTDIRQKVRVVKATYPKITVKVAKRFTEPNQTQLAAISVDKGVKEKTFSTVSPQMLWTGKFAAPVSAPVSDVFGTERVFNGEVQSRHQGLDYAVPAGTPIHAINKGIVVLARPMYFEGSFIVIDHGQGLLSLYLHLSEFRVKEGQEVGAGDVIGLSGGTGRATGAHLHLAVRWQGIYLDPAVLLKLPFPSANRSSRPSVPIS